MRTILPCLFALAICIPLAACDGAASGTDSGTGRDGGGTPVDSGGTGTDSGGTPTSCPATLPEVPIRFSGCTALAACGGDPTGVWVYDDICVEDAIPDPSAVCADARIEDLMGTARGCVALDGTNAARSVSGEVSATIVVPVSCTFGMGCGVIESALGVTCTEMAGDCRCPYSTSWSNTETNTYTVSGTTLTTSDGTSYDFCVMGNSLRYTESGSTPTEPGVASLTR